MHEKSEKVYSFRDALTKTLQEEMRAETSVYLLGEEAGAGGRYGVTKGLQDEFGPKRVLDAPISEELFVGFAIGAAQAGMRMVVEFAYANLFFIAFSDIFRAGISRSKSSGALNFPMVIRAAIRNGDPAPEEVRGDPIGMFLPIPGIKIVTPSSPRTASGLLRAAMRDNNPVIFFEHDLLYDTTGIIPDNDEIMHIGNSSIETAGENLTLISCGRMAHIIRTELGDELRRSRIEFIDLLTIKPLDIDTIIKSVHKTGKMLVVEEGRICGGIGAEISARVHEMCENITARRIGVDDVPLTFGTHSNAMLPSARSIRVAIQSLLEMPARD